MLSALRANWHLRRLLVQSWRDLIVHVQVDPKYVLRGEPHPAAWASGAPALGVHVVRLLSMLAQAERVREPRVALVAGVGSRARVDVEVSHQRLLAAKTLGAERACVMLLFPNVAENLFGREAARAEIRSHAVDLFKIPLQTFAPCT